jgi:aminomethyltransferase
MAEKLQTTPLHRHHIQLGARMVPFAGYEMPVQYSGLLEEAKAVRSAAGLFDVSHMGQFAVRGNNPLEEIQKLVTNDLSRLQMGQAQYNMLCNEKGGVIDDLVVYRRSEKETYICVNASNRKADYEWMTSRLPATVTLTDESDDTALIALQGPKAEEILCAAADATHVKAIKYYWAADVAVFGFPCFLSRTGYTGEDGFELYVAAKNAGAIWERLLEQGRKARLVPAGLGARDTLRLEMGYPLHGHELSPTITPLEANLGWVVKLQKAVPFIGQEALKAQAAGGPGRLLRAFVVEDRRIARQGYRICLKDRKPVGEITSGTMSPHLGVPIALGFVAKASADSTELFAEVREALVPLKPVKLPFVPSRTKK